MQAPPSGEQYGIAHRDSEAVITQVGATLRRYRVGALDVIDGFESARARPMAEDRCSRPGPTG